MAIVKNKDTQQNRDFWEHVETVAKQVHEWPNWIAHRHENREQVSDASQTLSCSRGTRTSREGGEPRSH